MDYKNVENLATLAKKEDFKAKEELMREFTPFILSVVNKTYVKDFESQDLKNHCYMVLFKCLKLYNPQHNRFAAYAMNSIKNSLCTLIRKSVIVQEKEGPKISLLEEDQDESVLQYKDFALDNLLKSEFNHELNSAIKSLTKEEQQFIHYVFIKNYTLKDYADFRGITYRKAVYRKIRILGKLKVVLNKTDYMDVFK